MSKINYYQRTDKINNIIFLLRVADFIQGSYEEAEFRKALNRKTDEWLNSYLTRVKDYLKQKRGINSEM